MPRCYNLHKVVLKRDILQTSDQSCTVYLITKQLKIQRNLYLSCLQSSMQNNSRENINWFSYSEISSYIRKA